MWSNVRVLNVLALMLTLFAVVTALAFALNKVARAPVFAIRHVSVSGALKRVDPTFLDRIIRTELRGSFFTVNLAKVKAALQRAPWVKHVAVKRVWPRTLVIVVTEHEPVAKWNTDALLSTDGSLFQAQTTQPLPLLSGPDGADREVLAKYQQTSGALSQHGLAVTQFSMSPSRSLSAITNSDMKIEFGRDAFDTRLARLADNLAQLRDRVGVPITSVDLRYGKGIAVALAAQSPSPSLNEQPRPRP